MHPNPNNTLCPNNMVNTWPHLLYTCSNPHIKGLHIVRHNKAIHQIAHTLQSHKHTRFYTLIIIRNHHSRPQDNRTRKWVLQCTCTPTPCTCLVWFQLDILCVLGAPNDSQSPLIASPPTTIQFIEITYCHDRFPTNATQEKQDKYLPLIQTLRIARWQIGPLITIIAGVRRAIHKCSIQELKTLKISANEIKNLMKQIHRLAIKYLTYLVLNKWNLNIKQAPIDPP